MWSEWRAYLCTTKSTTVKASSSAVVRLQPVLLLTLAKSCQSIRTVFLSQTVGVILRHCRMRFIMVVCCKWITRCMIVGCNCSNDIGVLQLYHIGGWNGTSTFKNVYAYDDGTQKWQQATDLPLPLYHHRCTQLNCQGFVCGGQTSNDVFSMHVF